MSEREDEIARGVSRGLQERDDKEKAKNGEAGIFALSWLVLVFALVALGVFAGLPFTWTLVLGFFGSIIGAGIIAATVSRKARARGAPGY